jgi:Spy/CpxP family protein refolding chaperone
MARRRSFLTLLSGIVAGCLAAVSSAEPPPAPEHPPGDKPKPGETPKRFFHRGGGPSMGPEADAMRERAMHELQKLSPEQRADLWKAVWSVINLPPDKRQMLLGMDEDRRRMAREEIERALSENGIQLDEEKKKVFVRRYFEERRAIEEKLRKESDEKRHQLLGEMRAKLKQEFGSTSAKTPPGEGTK